MDSQPSTLNPDLLLQAYASGIFPMGLDDGEIGWFSPDPRGIIPLDAFHVPHGLERTLQKKRFSIRLDHDFKAVMRACAEGRDTWISKDIVAGYTALHEMGFAHSVEAWSSVGLAGGLYGVSIGGAFFGESMFYRETDASKVALVALVEHLRAQGFQLLDTQWVTPHLATFGAINISRKKYLEKLRSSLKKDCQF